MIQKTKWKPDTCECEIVYEWDDSLPDDQRVHTLASIQKCQHHAKHDDDTAYDQVLNKENKLKNMVLGEIGLEEASFTFDKSRTLEVTLPVDKTAQEKLDVQDLVDVKHGQGKVIIK